MRLLGIETSCDETAAGLVDGWKVCANIYHTQAEHAVFGGVVPEIASREHLRRLPGIVRQALEQAGWDLGQVEGIAFTRGPGLAGPLLVGANFARSLGLSLGIPVYGANHLEGHLAAVRLSHPQLRAPFLCLTVSGGHTELSEVLPGGIIRILGETRDDAAGEAFDKCGKVLGLGYPAGPLVSREARAGDPKAFALPRGLRHEETLDFSFSGLKSAVSRLCAGMSPQELRARRADLCASLEEAIVDALAVKALRALEDRALPGMVICGGVSANSRLRERLEGLATRKGAFCLYPEPALCTDNGTMIAAAALWRLEEGRQDGLSLDVEPRLAFGS